jgi:uncharacterized caspase-like protein
MRDYWAVVIGINEYWRREACLQGARADALLMCQWLLKDEADGGGGVPPRQLFVILDAEPVQEARSDAAGGTGFRFPPAVNLFRNTGKKVINDVLANVCQKSGGLGDRLYFYFAGHGLTALENGSGLPAVAAGDFNWANTENSLSLQSILDYFKATEFEDQFFFIDACRNILREGKLKVGGAPWPKERRATAPQPQQFVLFATSPGVEAAEIAFAGRESGGAFTDGLLRALDGEGSAKVYDPKKARMLVRWNKLFDYVLRDVTARQFRFKAAKQMREAELIQVPQDSLGQKGAANMAGQPRDTDPILTSHDPARFPKVDLDVRLEPPGTRTVATVWVHGPPRLKTPVETASQISGSPVSFKLAPRWYNVIGEANGYEPVEDEATVELYQNKEITLMWKPLSATQSAGPPAPPPGSGGQGAGIQPPAAPLRSGEGAAAPASSARESEPLTGAASSAGPSDLSSARLAGTRGSGLEPPEASPELPEPDPKLPLVVDPGDCLALVDLLDMSGALLQRRHGKLKTELPPGAYKVRLRTPEGQATEQIVALKPRDGVSRQTADPIRPVAPQRPDTPFIAAVRNTGHFAIDDKNMLHVSERVGAMAAAELSTVLALAGTLATYPPEANLGWGGRLRSLGLLGPAKLGAADPQSATEDSGLYVVFGDELSAVQAGAEERPDLGQVRLRLSRVGAETDKQVYSPAQVSDRLGVAGGLAEFFAARPPGLYWFMVEAPGRPPALFSLTLLPGRLTLVVFHRQVNQDVHVFQYFPSLHPDSAAQGFDPQYLRFLELIQRYYLRGHFADIGDPARLLEVSWSEPLGAFLAGYLFLRAGRVTDAKGVADGLLHDFPWSSDVHVLKAECEDALGRPERAVSHYRAALDTGLPTFAEGLARLWVKITHRKIDHRQVGLVNEACTHRVPGLIWTAFTPPVPSAKR